MKHETKMKTTWRQTTATRAWVPGRTQPAGRAPAGLRLTREHDQIWEGFGGCFNELGWKALNGLSATVRASVLRALFDPLTGCRFDIGRVPIGASDYAREWYSLNETAGDYAMKRFSIARDRGCLLPYIRAALAIRPDLTLFASPWSPPTWMKDPPVYNYGTLVWTKRNLDAYALYLVKFVQAYAREGVSIRQVHPQNEPAADQKFPSCRWTGAQMRDFIRDHLGPAFRKHGLNCEVWLGTLNTDDYDGFPNTVLSDPRANRYVAGVGFQWAGKGAIQRTHAAWPEKRLMQTENECGDGRNTWEYAEYVFGLVQHYVANGAGAYVYWNMVLPEGGRSSWGWTQNAMITVDPVTQRARFQPEYWVMRHASTCIEPGAVRVRVEGPWAGNAFAFENPNGARTVVAHNPFDDPRELVCEDGPNRWTARLPPHSFNTLTIA